jgi:hypothetical protein
LSHKTEPDQVLADPAAALLLVLKSLLELFISQQLGFCEQFSNS